MSIDGLQGQTPGPDMDRREYAALPVELARRLRRAWRATVDPRAATARGYPFPLRSWPPDAAVDIQNLAEAIDADVAGLAAAKGDTLDLLPTQGGMTLALATFITDPSGNADFQFAPHVFQAPPIVVASPIHLTLELTCVIAQVTTTRAYATVRNAAGMGVSGITVHFVVIGRLV